MDGRADRSRDGGWFPRTAVAMFLLCAAAGLGRGAAPGRPPHVSTESGKRPYWIFLSPAPDGQAARAAPALSPRAIRRLEKAGRTAGADPRDRSIIEQQLAPLRERGIVVRHLSRWLCAASALLSDAQAREVAADSRVAGVRPVTRFVRVDEPNPAWVDREMPIGAMPRSHRTDDPAARDPRTFEGDDYGPCWEQLEMLGVPELHRLGYSGLGVLVALFDTGFYKSHESLSRLSVAAERDFLCGDGGTQWQPGDTCGTRRGDEHGTYIWSALGGFSPGRQLGAAYRASFVLARTEEREHETHMEEDNYIAALEWADSLGVDIVSSSLGYRYRFDDGSIYTIDQLDGETIPITQATEIAAERGILIVTAMGNDGPEPSTLNAPADGKEVVSVGAVDFAGAVASFSSRGPTGDGRIKPDVVASGVTTACATADTPGSYGRVNGTSLATPLIAGLSALLLEAHPAWTPDSVIIALRSSGDHADAPTYAAGWGVADGPRALRVPDARLVVSEVEWRSNAGSSQFPDWGERGRVLIWLRNAGAQESPPARLWVGQHDDLLGLVDSSAVSMNPVAPGERDSVGIPLQIANEEEFTLASFFLKIEIGERIQDRKITLAIPQPYTLSRFDARVDSTGTVDLSWGVVPMETASLGNFGYRLYREDRAGVRTPLQEGNLDWWVHEWTDRPPKPDAYRYWLKISIRAGLYTSLEGPIDLVVPCPRDAAIGLPYPNPAQGEVLSIPLAWARGDDPRIQIFDIAGRRIRVLTGSVDEGCFPVLEWDLRDHGGRRVASGPYFLRLPGVGSARVLVVR
jgi:hypothetical protein